MNDDDGDEGLTRGEVCFFALAVVGFFWVAVLPLVYR